MGSPPPQGHPHQQGPRSTRDAGLSAPLPDPNARKQGPRRPHHHRPPRRDVGSRRHKHHDPTRKRNHLHRCRPLHRRVRRHPRLPSATTMAVSSPADTSRTRCDPSASVPQHHSSLNPNATASLNASSEPSRSNSSGSRTSTLSRSSDSRSSTPNNAAMAAGSYRGTVTLDQTRLGLGSSRCPLRRHESTTLFVQTTGGHYTPDFAGAEHQDLYSRRSPRSSERRHAVLPWHRGAS